MIEVVDELWRCDSLISPEGKTPVVMVLDGIVSTPYRCDALLVVVGRNDPNGMQVDRKFDSRDPRGLCAIEQDRVSAINDCLVDKHLLRSNSINSCPSEMESMMSFAMCSLASLRRLCKPASTKSCCAIRLKYLNTLRTISHRNGVLSTDQKRIDNTSTIVPSCFPYQP